MKITQRIILLVLILFGTNATHAQNPLMRKYTTIEGLASLFITDIIQDKEGYIWISTEYGVSRFDGKKFQNYTIADGLTNLATVALKEDSKGRIWFLGAEGTVSYWYNGKIYNEDSDTTLREIKEKFFFYDLFEDNKGKLWFKTFHDNLVYDKGKVFRTAYKVNSTLSLVFNGKSGQIMLSSHEPYCTIFDHRGTHTVNQKFHLSSYGYWRFKDESILFTAKEGIVWQKDTVQKLILPTNGVFDSTEFYFITLSRDSILWINSHGKGLYCYNLKNPLMAPSIYFENKIVRDVFEDNEGNIWIAVEHNGLYMIPETAKSVFVYHEDSTMFIDNNKSVFKNKNRELVVIQSSGNNKISKRIKTPDNTFSEIYKIKSLNNDLWICTVNGLIHRNVVTNCNHWIYYKDSITGSDNRIFPGEILIGRENILIGSGRQILKYPLKCHQKSSEIATIYHKENTWVFSIYLDRSNNLWIGTNKGLKSLKDNSIIEHKSNDPILSHRFHFISETEDSVLILGSHGYGLLFYKNGKITKRITTEDGLVNDICRRIYFYKNRIYVASPTGISILNYRKGSITEITQLNNINYLPSNDIGDIYVDNDVLIVESTQGIVLIKQAAVRKIITTIPLLKIIEVKKNDLIISKDEAKKLPYDVKNLKFSFIGIFFQQPENVNYRYRISKEQIWQSTINTQLEFSFLEPGKYNFQLQSRVGEGPWSPIKSFAFTITPPFWKTNWFRALTILFLGAVFFWLWKRRLRVIRNRYAAKAEIEKQIADLRQQALQTMMNPHFIFNVMNSIQHLVNENNKAVANRYLSDFATLIRMNLSISYKKVISIEEEIEYLNLYLSFEKLRFGDKLSYVITIDPDIETSETMITVMMIQPFIENAIWHGILPLKTSGHIQIQIDKVSDNVIKITVEDNGVGIDNKFIGVDYKTLTNESHALNMTVQRLHLLSKSSGHELYLRFKYANPSIENKGTIAELLLPVTY